MEYCIHNKSGSPINVFGLIIPANGRSRALSNYELNQSWSEGVGDNAVLEPILMETASRKEEAVADEQTISNLKESSEAAAPRTSRASGASRRGRQRSTEK